MDLSEDFTVAASNVITTLTFGKTVNHVKFYLILCVHNFMVSLTLKPPAVSHCDSMIRVQKSCRSCRTV